MILILVRFMQIGRARESWQIYHKALLLNAQLNLTLVIGFTKDKERCTLP